MSAAPLLPYNYVLSPSRIALPVLYLFLPVLQKQKSGLGCLFLRSSGIKTSVKLIDVCGLSEILSPELHVSLAAFFLLNLSTFDFYVLFALVFLALQSKTTCDCSHEYFSACPGQ